MVPPAILPSPAVLCGECLPTELGNEQRKYPPCFPQSSGVAAQSLGLFGLQLWEVEAAEPRDVWEGWRSHGAFGGNSWVHLGPLPAGGINPLQFHLPLAGLRMSRVGEEEGGKARDATIMKEPCAVTQGFGSGSSGKDRCWHGEVSSW